MLRIKLILLMIISVNTFKGFSQKDEGNKINSIQGKMNTLTTEASFPGGEQAFLKFIDEHWEPNNDDRIECMSKFYLEFYVDTAGNCSNFHIIRNSKNNCSEYDSQFIKMLEKMPKWLPAKINGKEVEFHFLNPIYICLN